MLTPEATQILQWTTVAATVVVMLAAVYTDIKWGKIFNALTAPFVLLGLVLNTLIGGWGLEGLLGSFFGVVIGVGLWFVINILGRILGAGDSKLLAAIGALQGYVFLFYAFIGTALAGGILAIVVALWRGYLRASLRNLVRSLYSRIFHKMPIDIETAAPQARLPYAVPIFFGSLAALYYVYIYLPAA